MADVKDTHEFSIYHLGAVVLLLGVLVGAVEFIEDSQKSPFVSSEVRFTDMSASGLAIVPASCPSNPHSLGECTCLPVAPPTIDALGNEVYAGDSRIERLSEFFCTSNTSGSAYFAPGNTTAELQAFMTNAKNISGLGVKDFRDVILLHSDGADGSTTITDNSVHVHAITRNGNTQIDTAQSKFGSASILFNGSTDSLTFIDSTDWNFGGSTWTIDMWIRPASLHDARLFTLGQDGSNGNIQLVIQANGQLRLEWRNDAGVEQAITGGTYSANAWTHVAATRLGTAVRFFVNGTLVSSAVESGTIWDASQGIIVGARRNVSGGIDSYFNGHIDELRVSNGWAHWDSDFTPPTQAY